MPFRFAIRLSAAVLLVLLAIPGAAAADDAADRAARADVIRGSFGTYGLFLTPDGTDATNPKEVARTEDGHVDVERLVRELVDLKVNTYHWLIWQSPHDWEDLKRFLPLARKEGILVWVCTVPPSECGKWCSEPFRTDYARWGREIAQLSVRKPNLVAWSIDDFTHNTGHFTPEALRKILDEAHAINPRLAFVACGYYPSLTAEFARRYAGLVDGVLFPYRGQSRRIDFSDASLIVPELKRVKANLGPDMPVIVDLYVTAYPGDRDATPEYVEKTMRAGGEHADGVHIYAHQNPVRDRERYRALRKHFHEWAADADRPKPRNPGSK